MRSLAFLLALLAALLLPSCSALADPDWSWPVRGPVLTRFLNGDDPYAAGQHRGIDIGADVGTPVVAATPGTVVYAGTVGSSGLTVAQRAGEYELSYLHLSSVVVRSGDRVEAGERIGAVGVSGTRSIEQPHLHFGVRAASDRHAYLDPLRFLPPVSGPDPKPQPVPVAAPDPVAAPAPVAAAPAAQPVSAPVPAPRPLPAPHHALHASHGVAPPRHAAVAGPRAVAAPHAGARPGPLHAAVPAQAAAAGAPARGPAARLAGARGAAVAPVRERDATHRDGGIDLAWLAACAGLVAAAVLLARPASRGGGRRSRPSALGVLLRAATTPARARARQ